MSYLNGAWVFLHFLKLKDLFLFGHIWDIWPHLWPLLILLLLLITFAQCRIVIKYNRSLLAKYEALILAAKWIHDDQTGANIQSLNSNSCIVLGHPHWIKKMKRQKLDPNNLTWSLALLLNQLTNQKSVLKTVTFDESFHFYAKAHAPEAAGQRQKLYSSPYLNWGG